MPLMRKEMSLGKSMSRPRNFNDDGGDRSYSSHNVINMYQSAVQNNSESYLAAISSPTPTSLSRAIINSKVNNHLSGSIGFN